MSESLKTYRVKQLVAACIKTKKTPTNCPSFADWIYGLTATYFGITRRSGRGYLRMLIDSWKFDRWTNFVKNNPFLAETEKEQWISKHS